MLLLTFLPCSSENLNSQELSSASHENQSVNRKPAAERRVRVKPPSPPLTEGSGAFWTAARAAAPGRKPGGSKGLYFSH